MSEIDPHLYFKVLLFVFRTLLQENTKSSSSWVNSVKSSRIFTQKKDLGQTFESTGLDLIIQKEKSSPPLSPLPPPNNAPTIGCCWLEVIENDCDLIFISAILQDINNLLI